MTKYNITFIYFIIINVCSLLMYKNVLEYFNVDFSKKKTILNENQI